MEPEYRVWVSRRWLWAKKYRCKGIEWCTSDRNGVPVGTLLLILKDESRVWINTNDGKTVRYGPEFFRWQQQEMLKETKGLR